MKWPPIILCYSQSIATKMKPGQKIYNNSNERIAMKKKITKNYIKKF